MSDFNLGTVTAYGYAKDKGYTGTEDDFSALMASYADVAEQAAESAEQAAASATTATAKASEAAQSATAAASSKTAAETAQGGAETAAQTATTKAGEASTAATTATNKATEATTAATTATGKATEAAGSATTATTKAGEASTSATNAAASATRAQEILDSIPEDYSQLSEDVSDLKDGLTAVESDVTDLKEDLNENFSTLTTGIRNIDFSGFDWVVGRINGQGVPYNGDGKSKRTNDFIDLSMYSYVEIKDIKSLSGYALTVFAYKKSDNTFVEIVGGAVHTLPYRLVTNADHVYKFEWRNANVSDIDISGLQGDAPSELDYLPQIITDHADAKYATLSSKNMINKDDVTEGEYVNSVNGTFPQNVNFWRTGFLEVEQNETYTLRYVNQVAFYDGQKNYISGVSGYSADTAALPSTFQAPKDAKYIVVCGHTAQLDSDQLEKGSTFTTYYPYKKMVDELYLTESPNISAVLQYASTTTRIKLIGDSITHGVGGTGFAMDGDLIIVKNGSYYRNPNGYCWANLLKEQLEAEYNCTVTNNAIKGRATSYYVENADVLIGNDNDIVICMLGTNNRGTQELVDALIPDLQYLYEYCYSRGQKFILMAASPTSNADESTKIIHMDDVQHAIHAVASKNRIGFIDVYSKFYNYAWYRGIDFTTLLADGIHPNDSGYYVMYRIIAEALGVPAKIENATWDD